MSRAFFRSEWLWSCVLLLVAATQLAHRTPPVKRDSFFFDFSNVYSASRAWLEGGNPYSMGNVYRAWDASGHGAYLGTSSVSGMHTWAAVYPPSSLLLVAPFAFLRAVPGHVLWMAFSMTLLIASFAALFSLAGLRDWSGRVLLISCALASAPLQCAMESGQPALPAAALVILAVWAFATDRLTLAGILLGLATVLKIQIGGPFIIYYLFIRQWRVGAVAGAIFAIATLLTIWRMEAAGIGTWLVDWRRNIAITLEAGQINDPRPGGPFRNDMVNLQTLLDVVLHRQVEVDLAVILVMLPLLMGLLSRVRPDRAAGRDLLALSLVAALSMLPLYHRLYDGVLLMMLLAWGIARLRTGEHAVGITVLALLSEFLLPIDLVPSILHRTHALDSAISSGWWQGLVVPHHAWGLLILTVGVLYIFHRRTRAVAGGGAGTESGYCVEVDATASSV